VIDDLMVVGLICNEGIGCILIRNDVSSCGNVCAASGTLGNVPRNFLHDQNLWNLDASVFRIFPIAEGFKLKLDLEAFNALNHPVLNNPGSYRTTASSFGKITGFQSGNANRILQGSVRFQF
jgi:hypothetical protein